MNLRKLLLVYLTAIISRNTDTKGLEYNPLNDLIHKLLINKDYVILVRPTLNATSRLTRVETELKLLQIDLDDKNFDDYLEMYSNGNVNSTYDFKLISDAFNKFLDLKKPKSTQSNVDFKNISNSDEELIDFDVNLIESNINELLSMDRNDDEEEEDSDAESDSFYEIKKSELNDVDEEDIENKNLKEVIDFFHRYRIRRIIIIFLKVH